MVVQGILTRKKPKHKLNLNFDTSYRVCEISLKRIFNSFGDIEQYFWRYTNRYTEQRRTEARQPALQEITAVSILMMSSKRLIRLIALLRAVAKNLWGGGTKQILINIQTCP